MRYLFVEPDHLFANSGPAPFGVQMIELYRQAGWWNDDWETPRLLERLIHGSHCFLIAVAPDGTVAGMGRAISDRAGDAYIQDVTVRKDFRGTGIGSAIITRIVERLAADGITWVALIAEGNSHAFYEKLGFSPMPDSVPLLRLLR
jgi:spermidine synthase